MKITLIGFGTRGDVQPLIALGNGLKAAGHSVAISAASDFQMMVESAGFVYAPIQTNMHALMNSDAGKVWTEESRNSVEEGRNMRRMIGQVGETFAADLLAAIEDADLVVSGLTSFGMAQAATQLSGQKHVLALFSPLNPTSNPAATMMPMIPGVNIFMNKLSGKIAQYFTYWVFKEAVNKFRESLGLKAQTYRDYAYEFNHNTKVLYGVSPQVMPQPKDWGQQLHVTGYWVANSQSDWQPSAALHNFLSAGEPPVYIGFGSMSNKNPEATTEIMISALQRAGRRGIIHSGWAGLQSANLPDDIFVLDFAPHDWLFPQMAGIIQHGGAGTTAAALYAGVPSSVVAHMADQPFWGRRIYELGVGGKPIRRHNLTAENLAAAIHQITTDIPMKQKAQALAQRLKQEDGAAEAVSVIEDAMGHP